MPSGFLRAIEQCSESTALFCWGRWNKEPGSGFANLRGRGAWKVSFLGKRADNVAQEKSNKAAPLPFWDVEEELSLPKDYGILFLSFLRGGVVRLVYAFLLNLSNNGASLSLEQLFPVQLTLFLPLPLCRGKHSSDDVWAQLQALIYFLLSCSGRSYSFLMSAWIFITGPTKKDVLELTERINYQSSFCLPETWDCKV